MKTNRPNGRGNSESVIDVCVASCKKVIAAIQQARDTILDDARDAFRAPERLLRLALNEAEALAWESEYPQLVYPTLAQEKVQSMIKWDREQQRLLRKQAIALQHLGGVRFQQKELLNQT